MGHWSYAGRPLAEAVISTPVMQRSPRDARGPGSPSVAGAVAQFAVTGFVVLLLFLAGSLLVFRSFGRSEALRNARQLALLSGQGIVEPALRNGVLRGDRAALGDIDRVVQERVLGEQIVRVKIWSAAGRILYSDEPRLVGARYPLDDSKREALLTGKPRAELSSLKGEESRFERGQGSLYEVYLPIRAPDGTPLLFETYQRSSSVTSISRRIWVPFAALLLGSLVLLWLVQVPLAVRLARRLRRSQLDREALLIRAIEASGDERRRIAGHLHDDVVQDLAGISYSLSAAADTAEAKAAPGLRAALLETAAAVRDAIRRIRSLLVEIHPPNLSASGLEAALRDLVAPLPARGVAVTLDVPADLPVDEATEQLLYRAAGEAIRNAERHSKAGRLSLRLSEERGRLRLEVEDDGIGFAPERRDEARAQGHVGLSLLEELVTRSGGTLEIRSAPGAGTTFVLEVPGP